MTIINIRTQERNRATINGKKRKKFLYNKKREDMFTDITSHKRKKKRIEKQNSK